MWQYDDRRLNSETFRGDDDPETSTFTVQPVSTFNGEDIPKMNHFWRYGAASATIAFFDAGLCTLDLRGPITYEVLLALQHDIIESAPRVLFAFVVHWDKTILAVTVEELRDTYLALPAASVLRLPAANVVSAEQLTQFQRHAINMMDRMLMRVTTCSSVDALTWAARRCGVETEVLQAQVLRGEPPLVAVLESPPSATGSRPRAVQRRAATLP